MVGVSEEQKDLAVALALVVIAYERKLINWKTYQAILKKYGGKTDEVHE